MKVNFKTKKYRILLVTIGLIFLLAGIKFFQIYSAIQAAKGRGAPPATVNTYVVETRNWPKSFTAVGSLRATQGSILSAEDAGRIAKVNFNSGDIVKEGQVLVELDSEVEKSQLAAAEANYKLAQLTVKRQRDLRGQNANSQLDLDTAEANFSLAQAELSRLKAVIKRRQIVAPFEGVAGVRQVDVGEFVALGTRIVDLNSFDTFLLDFYLPQNQVKEFKLGDIVNAQVRGLEDQIFQGSLTGINSQIDPVSRNILLQATIKNIKDLLRPGMFVELELIKDEKLEVPVIPLTSISYAPYGNTVYSIDKSAGTPPFDIVAHTVTLGRERGDFVEVLSGLKVGEEIVASGTFKLFPGVKIFIDNNIKPAISETPQVDNT